MSQKLQIYVSPYNLPIITDDGSHMTVRNVYVQNKQDICHFWDCEIFSNLTGIEILVIRKFFTQRLHITAETEKAAVTFLQTYHAQQNIEFDCYAFANLVKDIEPHSAEYLLEYWNIKLKPWRIKVGDVVFFMSGKTRFHHAAIYIGFGLYISVYGAGGDIAVATLKQMKWDYRAEKVLLARPA